MGQIPRPFKSKGEGQAGLDKNVLVEDVEIFVYIVLDIAKYYSNVAAKYNKI